MKEIIFKNEHKAQDVEKFKYADIDCSVVNNESRDGYDISEHIPIPIGFTIVYNGRGLSKSG